MVGKFVTENQANVTRKPLATNLLNNSKGVIAMRKLKKFAALAVAMVMFFTMVQVAPVYAEENETETTQTEEDLTQRYDPNDYGVKKSTKNGVTTIKFDGGKEKLIIKKNGEIYWDYVPLATLYGGALGPENIKFFGVDSEKNVYLKSYDHGIIFFNKKNIFSPLFFGKSSTINSETDKNGYLVNFIFDDEKVSIYDDLSVYDITIKEKYPVGDVAMKKSTNKYVCYFADYKMTGTVTWKKKRNGYILMES